jgi:Predicted pPIWI-associating nuclease
MFSTIVKSINDRLATQFELDLHEASLKVLEDNKSPIRFNSFAFSFRELTRHILTRLAPDENVLKCQWYENQTDKPNGITRIQRMLYAIKGGLSDEFIVEELNLDIKVITKDLKKAIDNLSKFTHINESTFNTQTKDGNGMVYKSLVTLSSFLETIESVKNEIQLAYEIRVSDLINDAVNSESINEIDILATHYLVEYAYVDKISVKTIDDSLILINISGSIDVEHQYGSDGDYRRGDGVRIESSYPFEVSTSVDVNYPLEIEIDFHDIKVDNSKFYE